MATLATDRPSVSAAPRPISRRSRAALLIPLALFLTASGLRLAHLGRPSNAIADESYYSLDAQAYLGGTPPFPGVPSLAIDGERSWVHPPFGKELIAAGEGPLGLRAIGWRLPSAIVGIVGVMTVYWLALLLWGSPGWAGLAGLLVAIDGLHLVMSRLAMLDVFAGTFAVAGLAALVYDRIAGERPPRPPGSGWGRWFERRLAPVFGSQPRFWSGTLFGCAVASKWSGGLTLAFAATLATAWAWRGELPGPASRPRRLRTVAACFLGLPLLVYGAAYAPFWAAHGPDVSGFLRLQRLMLAYHEHYDKVQPNASAPINWPLQLHPISAPFTVDGTAARIVTIGNPALWYGFLLALPVLVWLALARGAWRERVVLGGYLSGYAPWLLVHRQTFFYYMVAVVPFMALGVVAVLRRLPARARRPASIGLAATAVALFGFFAPVLLGVPVSQRWLDATRWLPHWG